MKKIATLIAPIALTYSLNAFPAIATEKSENQAVESALTDVTANGHTLSERVLNGLGQQPNASGSIGQQKVTNQKTTLSVSSSNPELLNVTRNSLQISITVSTKTGFSRVFELPNGESVAGNAQGMYSTSLAKADGSIQFLSVFTKAASLASVDYIFTLPNGFSLVQSESNGLVMITNEHSQGVGAIAPAWSLDANGGGVKTHYEVNGNILRQVFDVDPQSLQYPVVADPWLGFDLIDHTQWVNTSSYSPTLSVYPTDWGRTVAYATTFPLGGPVLSAVDILSSDSAWSETLSKTAHTGHPSADTSTMRAQFQCHFFYVSKRAPNKPSWNLDSQRPYASLLDQVLNNCNVS